MLCFPQLVHSPKTPRQELLPLPSAALWGSPKDPSWLLLSGDQHWVCPHQPRTARTQNTAVLLSLSLEPVCFWYSSSTHSAEQSACPFRLESFHGYRLGCCYKQNAFPTLSQKHQVFTYAAISRSGFDRDLYPYILQMDVTPQGGAGKPARHPIFSTVRNGVGGISWFLWSLTG